MTQSLILLIGALVSKIIIACFIVIGAAATGDYLRTNYTTNYQILYGGIILLWLLLGVIYEFNKFVNKGVT
jgi:hypothetical protein